MHIVVTSTESGTSIDLDEPADHTRLDVLVIGTRSADVVHTALAEAGVGGLADHGQASIRPAALRRLAGDTDESWQASFDRMVRYARAKGWVNEQTQDLAAHVRWPAC
jgi:hypothetical protein